jgi:hypothetical protein
MMHSWLMRANAKLTGRRVAQRPEGPVERRVGRHVVLEWNSCYVTLCCCDEP